MKWYGAKWQEWQRWHQQHQAQRAHALYDQALALLHGMPLYRPNMDTPPYTIANYPPIYILALIPFKNPELYPPG